MNSPRDIFNSKVELLLRDVDVDRVSLHLFRSGVLTSEDQDEVTTPRDMGKRRVILLMKLLNRIDSESFGKFLEALKEAEQEEIFEKFQAQCE